MLFEELEEALDELFPNGYSIETDPQSGQLVIFTGLKQDDDDELVPADLEEDEDIDSDNEPLEDEDLDDED